MPTTVTRGTCLLRGVALALLVLAPVLSFTSDSAAHDGEIVPEGHVRCFVPELEQYRSMIQPVEERVRTHEVGDPRRPPENPGLGDSWLWYTWRLAGFPQPELLMCTVRGVGENVYIVVEDSQWGTRVDQEDVDRMIEAWDHSSLGRWPDQGIHDLCTDHFGPVPDQLDDDPRVYVLYYSFDVSSDGFFWPFDMYPDGTQSFASNECEVLYMNSRIFDPGGDYLISVQAHEFQHMIHWLADGNEQSWINEGMSELAMWLYGHPDQIVSFPNNPDNNLTSWNGAFADYVKVYLWSLYFYEHFGGKETIRALVAEPQNGTFGVQQTLINRGYTETFAQVVSDWVTANWLDDPDIDGGRYYYDGTDLPPFAAVTRSSYPVPPTDATVNHWAADYIRFTNGQPLRLLFDGADTSDWTVRVIRFLGGVPLSVETMVLNAGDAGSVDLGGFGSDFDTAVMIVANVSQGGLTSYQYWTESIPASVDDRLAVREGFRIASAGGHPAAAHAAFRLDLDRAAGVRVTVHDVRGAQLRSLHDGPLAAGRHELRWDGLDAAGRNASGGVYFVRAEDEGGRHARCRVLLVR